MPSFWDDPSKFPGAHHSGTKRRRAASVDHRGGTSMTAVASQLNGVTRPFQQYIGAPSVETSASQTGELNVPRPSQRHVGTSSDHSRTPHSVARPSRQHVGTPSVDTGASQPGGFILAPSYRRYWMALEVALDGLLDHYLRDQAYDADSLHELVGVQATIHQQIAERMATVICRKLSSTGVCQPGASPVRPPA